jgi:hypothetical protein
VGSGKTSLDLSICTRVREPTTAVENIGDCIQGIGRVEFINLCYRYLPWLRVKCWMIGTNRNLSAAIPSLNWCAIRRRRQLPAASKLTGW